jgi:predicted metal-dependent phosphoesterase TrpH
MAKSTHPLLCELHAHTTWSDGVLTVPELVDLYGLAGFDVLAVTDHVLREVTPGTRSVHGGNFEVYLGEIEDEAERAWWTYGMLVLPGQELTYEDDVPEDAAHVVAVGTRRFYGLDEGLDTALDAARDDGALLIGAHPYTPETASASLRGTARLAANPEWAREAVHRLELVNRHDFFHWVARHLLPAVANGDFHRPEHLWTWKTVVSAPRDPRAVLELLRSERPVELTRLDAQLLRRRAA